jgi:2'-5' RNA ligase
MIRLFAALDTPPEIAEGLTRRQHGLADAQWRSADAFHVTLRFFGEIDEQRADGLDAALGAIRQTRFEIGLAGVGVFDEDERRSALWAGVAPSDSLNRLAAKCESAARRTGLKAELRSYRPHVTLAYLSGRPGPRIAAWIAEHNLLRSPTWSVTRFGLYSSRLGRGGSRYTLEREYDLQ